MIDHVFFSNSRYTSPLLHFAESDAAMMQFYCNTVDLFLLLTNEEVLLFSKVQRSCYLLPPFEM